MDIISFLLFFFMDNLKSVILVCYCTPLTWTIIVVIALNWFSLYTHETEVEKKNVKQRKIKLKFL